ncbi:MAG: hypothetical protein UR25_C0001G0164 [Candidatus Nomurabacteria bacterium GW2011_GWE1_32_28]|uniref:Uncharacterized protein n=1 Tax=Candidatus Nomurabacteria bacterium GW2011_GWF1_31_48 TaxID=1618767 RepID=A0A0F9YG69_9BACT|nr:MAG: hypothetical protein UR10_C0002G0115 [Candidatus Nomurabacteria bacterium GW2011_GWF2_30_133]KKP28996.1 MAG: hypothetical protein UR18_C0001G0117 [Candidatus Nomurabacteria bacterium GW2011_GWE2_31_40]KKP30594.1 MAG: hypothetical protein UR19_C0002G0115 [Candidatus Nomurabacteria bacterium GW2011_GWF1_31_48]KKP35251.1 MAG: hypothetical protein UR25_C0001G0164 [Candidatus Nomurabacteria bacterium GW2011_GWE1_32_28]HAS80558.1 hypothetical protein [Candidatus Nomurabacteria bacterium]
MGNFELEGWEDINQNGGTVGTGINRAIHKLTVAIFNSGSKTSTALGYAKDAIEKASSSSDKHTDALVRVTWILAIATGVLALATIALVIITFVKG